MSPHEPQEKAPAHAPAWSPETEIREDVLALLRRRSALTRAEVLEFRQLYPDIYDTYYETLRCVIRGHGARRAVEAELVQEAFTTLWDETVAQGFPESLQAKLLALASGLARNHVRREKRNPATERLPISSMQVPGSFPMPERDLDLKNLKEIARFLLERLSAEHKAVVDAVILRDLTVAAAARELKLRRTTASSRLTAALALLTEMAEAILTESERRL